MDNKLFPEKQLMGVGLLISPYDLGFSRREIISKGARGRMILGEGQAKTPVLS
jgi:hypothetical protein